MKRPIDNTEKFPFYFSFDDRVFVEEKPDVFRMKVGGEETAITKKANVLMEALLAGKEITKEEYEKAA